MQSTRSLLPLFAFLFTLSAFFYSACNESKAGQKPSGSSSLLVEKVNQFENELTELKSIQQGHIKKYSDEMGCLRDSKALEIVNHHNDLLEKNAARLKYHRMQLIQADTTNAERNNKQLEELNKDLQQLENDAQVIKTGFDNFQPAHITR
jgi:hypothetical protein